MAEDHCRLAASAPAHERDQAGQQGNQQGQYPERKVEDAEEGEVQKSEDDKHQYA